ncbi:hypothetical protein [Candidatus Xianfuyuplasma coldseepsis]|uniref:DUF2178 domain-containing protein n=1 Tax=Candidatus Xianfuyuplasma coldseepsis TaxID=2782163 RepID=A0A7L7KQF8_9MOLU|nr:hypothetical protein [Xianfuyuplasma coldseepsis]QMS84953.1 hypothetical protein G4Z02_04010 [Xianfuyuplasma coldseepsis]
MEPKKRMIIMLSLVFSVIAGTVLFTVLSGFSWDALIVVIIVLLFLVYSIPRFILNRNDVVSDDEYSKKIMRIAAGRSYIVSLYTWLAMMWFSKILDDVFPETTTKIGLGIGIMAIVFLINIIIVRITGVKE